MFLLVAMLVFAFLNIVVFTAIKTHSYLNQLTQILVVIQSINKDGRQSPIRLVGIINLTRSTCNMYSQTSQG